MINNNQLILANLIYKNDSLEVLRGIQNDDTIGGGAVFIKTATSNELGFRNRIPNKAGSFILIPKRCKEFFPSLSDIELNANVEFNVCFKPTY